MSRKVNVEVDAHFDAAGKMTPTAIKWEDGRVFQIDQVLDVQQAASMITRPIKAYSVVVVWLFASVLLTGLPYRS